MKTSGYGEAQMLTEVKAPAIADQLGQHGRSLREIERDGTVRYGTRILADRLRALGGNVRSTEYPAGYVHQHFGYPEAVAGHASWEPAYSNGDFRA